MPPNSFSRRLSNRSRVLRMCACTWLWHKIYSGDFLQLVSHGEPASLMVGLMVSRFLWRSSSEAARREQLAENKSLCDCQAGYVGALRLALYTLHSLHSLHSLSLFIAIFKIKTFYLVRKSRCSQAKWCMAVTVFLVLLRCQTRCPVNRPASRPEFPDHKILIQIALNDVDQWKSLSNQLGTQWATRKKMVRFAEQLASQTKLNAT